MLHDPRPPALCADQDTMRFPPIASGVHISAVFCTCHDVSQVEKLWFAQAEKEQCQSRSTDAVQTLAADADADRGGACRL